jgi:hypothetical protein
MVSTATGLLVGGEKSGTFWVTELCVDCGVRAEGKIDTFS